VEANYLGQNFTEAIASVASAVATGIATALPIRCRIIMKRSFPFNLLCRTSYLSFRSKSQRIYSLEQFTEIRQFLTSLRRRPQNVSHITQIGYGNCGLTIAADRNFDESSTFLRSIRFPSCLHSYDYCDHRGRVFSEPPCMSRRLVE